MLQRLRYQFDPEKVNRSVLLIWPINLASLFVYCPPIGNELPWMEEVADFNEAVAKAGKLAEQIGQPTVLITRDREPWWLNGLTAV
jgi:hypothetical protein